MIRKDPAEFLGLVVPMAINAAPLKRAADPGPDGQVMDKRQAPACAYFGTCHKCNSPDCIPPKAVEKLKN